MHVQLFVDGAQPVAQRVDADAQLIADLFVELALGQQRQDFVLPGRELFDLGGRLLDFAEMVHHLARDLHRHGRAARMDLFDRLQQLGERGIFL